MRSIREWRRRKRLDGVAENVKPRRRSHLGRHRPRVFRIEIPQRGLETTVGDAGFCVQPLQIEDRDAGGFAARTRGRWNRHERLQRTGNREPLADGRVHVVEKVRRRIRRVEIDGFRGVERRTTTDGDKGVERTHARERNGIQERLVRGFDPNVAVQRKWRDSPRATR